MSYYVNDQKALLNCELAVNELLAEFIVELLTHAKYTTQRLQVSLYVVTIRIKLHFNQR